VANNQETDRDTVNELIDDRTIHEITRPLRDDRQARASRSIMCAKNKVNGVYGVEQAGACNAGVLKDDLVSTLVVVTLGSFHDTVGLRHRVGLDDGSDTTSVETQVVLSARLQ